MNTKITRIVLTSLLLTSSQVMAQDMEAIFSSTTDEFQIQQPAGTFRFVVDGNGNVTINDAYTFPNFDGATNQVLQTDGSGTVTWSSLVDNIDDADADPSNEIQNLSISGGQISISGGNTVSETLSTLVDNGNGTFTYTAEDGSTVSVGTVGPAGPAGADGATGPQGPAGANGSDGATGPQGAAGAMGLIGPQGIQGITGVDGLDGNSAYDIAVADGFVGTEAQWLASLIGADGVDGNDGAIGATGPAGPTGPAGANGNDGAVGPAGADGATGPQGPIGPTGTTGLTGPQGTPGTDGQSAYDIAVVDGFVGTEAQWLASLVGADGVDGNDGAIGPAGPPGTNGNDGAAGPAGPAGTNGTDGAIGPIGPAGPPGTNGTDGAVGAMGLPGADGNDGATGPAGPTAVSADAGNDISLGAGDGLIFYESPIKAAGKINSDGTAAKIMGAASSRIDLGDYQITFSTAMPDANYIIMISQPDRGGDAGGSGNINDDPGITYYNQTTTGFSVNIGENDNGGTDRADYDSEFMFNIIDF